MTGRNILFAPAHYIYSKTKGSDRSVVYNTIHELSKQYFCYVICDENQINEVNNNLVIYELGTNHNRMLFYKNLYTLTNKIINEKEVDLVHHMVPFGYQMTFNPSSILNKLNDMPFVCGAINYPTINWEKDILNDSLKFMTRYLQKKTLTEAEYLVFDSYKTMRIYQNEYKKVITEKPNDVIYDGVELDLFNFVPIEPKSKFTIFTAAPIIERKGIQYLIKAIASISHEYSITLNIAGSGNYLEELKKLVKEYNLSTKVNFLGQIPREHIPKLMQASDLYVHPSTNETFPSILREAMATGRPIVSTSVGFINEHISSKNGTLVPSRNVDALANAIINLLSDFDLREKMSIANRKHAEKEFSYEHIAKKWMNVYEMAINRV